MFLTYYLKGKCSYTLDFFTEKAYPYNKMRVKKDKAYVVVTTSKGYVQGAFPFTEEGERDAYAYLNKLKKKTKEEYKVIVA